MGLLYRLLYLVGITPWENLATQPAAEQVSRMLDREEAERQLPYGKALDLGCGTGIWSVELAKRGWSVTGIDVIPKAVHAARERAREEQVELRCAQADVTKLEEADIGSDFELVLDFGTVHGLDDEEREAVGRGVTAITTSDASLVMYAVERPGGPPFPHAMNHTAIAETYPDWTIVDEQPLDTSGLPGMFAKRNPRWYQLRRN
ncbi:hypothetical protein BH23CHL2_BH23CHL2_05810 [soil metagenome]